MSPITLPVPLNLALSLSLSVSLTHLPPYPFRFTKMSSDYTNNQVEFYKGIGGGRVDRYNPVIVGGTLSRPYRGVACDLDGDSYLDLITTTWIHQTTRGIHWSSNIGGNADSWTDL